MLDARIIPGFRNDSNRVGMCSRVSSLNVCRMPPEVIWPHRHGWPENGATVSVLRCFDQEAGEMSPHPLTVPLDIAAEMGLIEDRTEAADDMTVDNGGRHRQKTVADRETPNGLAFDMGETPKEEGSQTIHQHSSWIAG